MNPTAPYPIQGAGLGLRRGLFDTLRDINLDDVDFLEVAPENWMRVGGRLARDFRSFTERFPLICHGLSLSLGSPAPLDVEYLRELKVFLDANDACCFTEHLSFCSDHGHLYDLMPIPFTEEAADYVAGRIRQVQDILEQRIGVEHVSYYAAPGQEMSELDFIRLVVERADCGFLLDVNNIYVNSINFGYDADAFLAGLPTERTMYVHIAGHYVEAEDLRIDTHSAAVIDPVWTLLDDAYERCGVMPTLLERDFNFPSRDVLLGEVDRIRDAQRRIGRRLGEHVDTG
jgi:uncharacterized protein (UPF0276 family)